VARHGAQEGPAVSWLILNRSGLFAADWYGQLMADLADLSPDRYAPLIAPVLERLTFAVVRMSVSRTASMPAPGGAPADAMRMFAQLRTALAARTVTAAGIAAVYRYRDPGEVRGDLDGLRAAGLIDAASDGAIEATEAGRARRASRLNGRRLAECAAEVPFYRRARAAT
jgi:hypothetical protein